MVVICREMTKIHEEVVRGRVSEVLEEVSAAETRGEFTLIVDGAGKSAAS